MLSILSPAKDAVEACYTALDVELPDVLAHTEQRSVDSASPDFQEVM